jgi:hypothetical protein
MKLCIWSIISRKPNEERDTANLRSKLIDNDLYKLVKRIAAEQNRLVGQEKLSLIKDYIAKRQKVRGTKSPGQVLLKLSGSWKDDRKPEEIISEIRKTRKKSGANES